MHACTVDNCDDIVKFHRKPCVSALLTDVSNRLSDGDRLADTGSFNDNIIIVLCLCQFTQLVRQVISQSAADAAVCQRNKVAVLLCDNSTFFNKIGVNIDFADIVDDNGGADAFIICKNVVQKSRLTCAEITGDKSDLYCFIRAHIFYSFHHARTRCAGSFMYSLRISSIFAPYFTLSRLNQKTLADEPFPEVGATSETG